jgi:hypothetical protein
VLIGQGQGLLEGERIAGFEIDLGGVGVENLAIARDFLFLIELAPPHHREGDQQ